MIFALPLTSQSSASVRVKLIWLAYHCFKLLQDWCEKAASLLADEMPRLDQSEKAKSGATASEHHLESERPPIYLPMQGFADAGAPDICQNVCSFGVSAPGSMRSSVPALGGDVSCRARFCMVSGGSLTDRFREDMRPDMQ